MPGLNTSLHLDMLKRFKKRGRYPLPIRIVNAIKNEILSNDVYGLHWGDPDVVAPLKFVRDRYVLPYVTPEHTAVEIGPGGGRWTRYLTGFRAVYIVDFYAEILEEVKKNFKALNLQFIQNNGTDFPGIPENTIDYLFSFGTFVHLDNDLIAIYLKNMQSIVKPGGNIVIQYSDKTKIMAQINEGFSDNTPEHMRTLATDSGFTIVEEDLTTLWHSSIIRLTL